MSITVLTPTTFTPATVSCDMNNEILTFHKFYNNIEYILSDIIDLIINTNLRILGDIRSIDTNTYYITGGKAINNILPYFENKSFDFDIHVSNIATINHFQTTLTNALNTFIQQPWKKSLLIYILNVLENNNLIDDDCIDYYRNTNTIFFYGNRKPSQNRPFIIPNLFLKLKLKKNIFRNHNGDYIYFTNINGEYNSIQPGTHYSELYIPYADIASDDVNFGIRADSNINLFTTLNKTLRYANLLLIIYNLICYIQENIRTHSNEKLKKNIFKLKKIMNMSTYSCSLFNTTYRNNINQVMTIIENHFNSNNLPTCNKITASTQNTLSTELFTLNNNNIFRVNRKIDTILSDFKTNYLNIYDGIQNFCTQNYILDIDIKEDNTYLLDYNRDSHLFETELKRHPNFTDVFRYSMITDKKSRDDGVLTSQPINTYLERKSLRLDHVDTAYTEQKIIDTLNNIDLLYNNLHNSVYNKDLMQNFTVYCCVEPYIIQNAQGTTDLYKMLKRGSIINIAPYQSTSYSRSYSYSAFINSSDKIHRIILSIDIDKKLKNWLPLDRSASIPNEKEILIKRNQYYTVKNNEIKLVKIRGGADIEVITINLILCDDLTDANNNAIAILNPSHYSLTNNKDFFNAVEYAYDNFFNKAYRMADSNPIDDKIYGIYRPNHGIVNALRKSLRTPIIIKLFEAHNSNDKDNLFNMGTFTFNKNNVMSDIDILKLSILNLFTVAGRDNEDGINDNAINYNNFLRQSAEAFESYANWQNTQNSTLSWTIHEISVYKTYIINKYFTKTRLIETYVLECTHDLDLIRVGTRYADKLNESKLNIMIGNENYNKLLKLSELMILATGDRLMSVNNGSEYKQTGYLPELFYNCSIRPKYTWDILVNVLFKIFPLNLYPFIYNQHINPQSNQNPNPRSNRNPNPPSNRNPNPPSDETSLNSILEKHLNLDDIRNLKNKYKSIDTYLVKKDINVLQKQDDIEYKAEPKPINKNDKYFKFKSEELVINLFSNNPEKINNKNILINNTKIYIQNNKDEERGILPSPKDKKNKFKDDYIERYSRILCEYQDKQKYNKTKKTYVNLKKNI